MTDGFPCDALVLAAGRGTRFGGDTPKQFRALNGDTVLARATAPFLDHCAIRHVVVVGPPDNAAGVAHALGPLAARVTAVAGGDTRQASAQAGLDALPEGDDRHAVLIHDGARPFVTADIITRVVAALASANAVIPAVRVADTLKRVEGRAVMATVPRENVVQAQTPQGFRTNLLRAAHRASQSAGHAVTDDAVAMEAAGHAVTWVEGHRANRKITTPDDMPMPHPLLIPRVGNGFDVHRLAAGGPMILGGITIDTPHHLVGHSDADVALHTITDAIFGALCDGDIGHHFPPSDETWRGASSDRFLAFAAERARERGAIAHIDLTIVCERPKIGPHREAMRQAIAEIVGVPIARVSVKATTTERLGFTGRGEGIAAQATVTLLIKDDADV